jgi:hypothetical protein
MTEYSEVVGLYFHINNGGIKFEVLQEVSSFEYEDETRTHKAPALRISAGHFGQQTNEMRFALRPEALRLLGETLIRASEIVVLEGDPLTVQNPARVRCGDEVTELEPPPVEAGSAHTN